MKLILFLILINFLKVVVPEEIIDCTQTDGYSYDSVTLICGSFREEYYRDYYYNNYGYRKVYTACYKSLFSYSRDSEVRILKTGNCKGKSLHEFRSYFRNLREFDISNYGVESLSPSDMTFKYLETFTAKNNNITTIPSWFFQNVVNLKGIYLSSNKINDLEDGAFSKLNDLRILDLNDNLIASIDANLFENNKKLKTLNLGRNPIKSIDCDLASLSLNSVAVEISWDNVRKIDTSCKGNTMKLRLDDNEVVFHLTDNNPELRCAKRYFEKLEYLNVSGNCLSNTSKILDLLDLIETLDLSNNMGSGAAVTERVGILNPFQRFSYITHLNLHHMNITNNGTIFLPFSNLKQLVDIDLSHNNVSEIRNAFTNDRQLKKLNISHNQIDTIDATVFSGTFNLNEIVLSFNKIRALSIGTFSELTDLRKLYIDHNLIKMIDKASFVNNKKLEYLNLEENPLYRWDCNIFSPLLNGARVHIGFVVESDVVIESEVVVESDVVEIDTSCTGNSLRFESTDFKNLYSFGVTNKIYFNSDLLVHLKHINISRNQFENTAKLIKALPPSVETLDASSNFLGKIDMHMFERFTNLEYLNLTNSSITFENSSHRSCFEKNKKLKHLSLEHNSINRLDSNIFMPLLNSVQVKISCENIVELDTTCLENSLVVALHSNAVEFLVKNGNSQLRCTKNDLQHLKLVNISGNNLQNTPKFILYLGPSVETLDLSWNFVGKLTPFMFEKFNNLKHLVVKHTNLTDFGFNSFYHQRKLEVLDISFNRLHKVDFTVFLRNFKELTELNLEGNNLTEVNTVTQAIFPKLRSLGISKNYFSCHYLAKFLVQWQHLQLINNPSNQTNIDGVDCYHRKDGGDGVPEVSGEGPITTTTTESIKATTENDLFSKIDPKNVRFDCRSPIDSASISCEHLEEIDSSCVENVVEMNSDSEKVVFHASNNGSQLLCDKEHLKHLRYLNISCNHMQNTTKLIKLLGPSIETLDLSSNFIGKLESLTFIKLSNLQYLNLSHTNLSNFGFSTFYHQSKLKLLDLSFNRLRKLNFTLLFRNFKHLEILNVEGNELIEVNSITRKIFPKLKYLGIAKNRFACDYLASFLGQWDDLQLLHRPTDHTHIGGVDCDHGETSTDSTRGKEKWNGQWKSEVTTGAVEPMKNFSADKATNFIETSETNTIETEISTIKPTEFISEQSETSSTEIFEHTSSDVENVTEITNETEFTQVFTDHGVTEPESSESSSIVDLTTDAKSTSKTAMHFKIDNIQSYAQPITTTSNFPLVELRTIEILLVLCVLLLVVKLKLVQRLAEKFSCKSSKTNLAYRYDARSSQHGIELIEHGSIGE